MGTWVASDNVQKIILVVLVTLVNVLVMDMCHVLVTMQDTAHQ
jgi:hypothetical protein